MDNTVTVGFSNNGQSSHYVVDNTFLASELDVGAILGSTFTSDNVTGGVLSSPYTIPGTTVAAGGDLVADYITTTSEDEAYKFEADGWNKVKNITVEGEGVNAILFIVDNFVHADIDFSGVSETVELRVFDAKRGNYLTGNGDDRIEITSATNKSGLLDLDNINSVWSNIHNINSGDGDDIVILGKGDDDLLTTSIVNTTNGRYTTVNADLGDGDDVYSSASGALRTMDNVDGGSGNDSIFTGAGDDIIKGGEDNGTLFEISDALYELVAEGDRLFGGTGSDEFIYSVGDGFGLIGDGFDYILDFEDADVLTIFHQDIGDTIETEFVTLQTTAGDLTGTMVSINGDASIFLEDFADIPSIDFLLV
jgi:Ca2+-binding RTX toxin-like protein